MSRSKLIFMTLVCVSAVILVPQEIMASMDGELFKRADCDGSSGCCDSKKNTQISGLAADINSAAY